MKYEKILSIEALTLNSIQASGAQKFSIEDGRILSQGVIEFYPDDIRCFIKESKFSIGDEIKITIEKV